MTALLKRPLYRHADLRRLFSPASVAVFGASPRPGSFAQRTIQELRGFTGSVFLVNPKYERIGDTRVYPSLKALPQVPDCVVITTPRDAVEDAAAECARIGVGAVVVYASGYAETGLEDRQRLQARLAAIGQAAGMRVLGPNNMGFANYTLNMVLSFVAFTRMGAPRRDAIGVATQSGAMSNALVQAGELGASFSHTLSAGNSCDVDVADLIAYLADEPACRVIACVLEGLSDPARFLEAADLAWKRGKPLVVYKMASGREGARAAASHTGILAGSNEAYAAAFDRCGAIVVPRFEDVVETAAFFAKAPAMPLSEGVAVVSTSGAAAIMSADAAELHAVALPQASHGAQAVLDARIPEFGSCRNPFDVTAQLIADFTALSDCVTAVVDDDAYGAVVMAQPQAYQAAVARVAMVGEAAARAGKMACNVLVSQWLSGPGSVETQVNGHVALFRSMDCCFRVLHAWHARGRRLQGERTIGVPERLSPPDAAVKARRLLSQAIGGVLTEGPGKQLLAAYGISTVPETLASSEAAAVAAAAMHGYPIAVKVESSAIPHKTEADVVRLNLTDESALRQAYANVLENAAKHVPGSAIRGVLVQPMIRRGIEVMVGARVDPQFGPLVVAGLGGVFVELLRDVSTALAPVRQPEALAMLARLKGVALLDGFRGGPSVEREQLAEVICRISELAADLADDILEIDVNPLLCEGKSAMAVDALIVTRQN